MERGETEQAVRRCAEFFRDLVVPAASGSLLQPVAEDMVRYGREIDNIRAVLDWCFSSLGDPTIGVVITAAYVPVWIHFALMDECRERAEHALASLKPEWELTPRLRMQVYTALGVALVYTMGSATKARTILAEGFELAASLDDVDGQLRTL